MSPAETTVVVCNTCGRKNRVPAAATGVPRCGNCHSALAWIVAADDRDYAELVDAAALPVLVDLWAPWCGPCRMVSPALERLAHRYAGRVKLVKVNVDDSPQVASRLGVRGIPTLVLLHRGRTVASQVGAVPEAALDSWLTAALAESGAS